ncbi:hypothetical protein T484DRAFT_1864685, partial [Baffinella frigidus]
ATSLARFGAPLPEEIGIADRVSVDEIGGIPCTTFVRDSVEQTKVSTIVLRSSPGNHLADDARFAAGGRLP